MVSLAQVNVSSKPTLSNYDSESSCICALYQNQVGALRLWAVCIRCRLFSMACCFFSSISSTEHFPAAWVEAEALLVPGMTGLDVQPDALLKVNRVGVSVTLTGDGNDDSRAPLPVPCWLAVLPATQVLLTRVLSYGPSPAAGFCGLYVELALAFPAEAL